MLKKETLLLAMSVIIAFKVQQTTVDSVRTYFKAKEKWEKKIKQ